MLVIPCLAESVTDLAQNDLHDRHLLLLYRPMTTHGAPRDDVYPRE
jgi:hypothetical protein